MALLHGVPLHRTFFALSVDALSVDALGIDALDSDALGSDALIVGATSFSPRNLHPLRLLDPGIIVLNIAQAIDPVDIRLG